MMRTLTVLALLSVATAADAKSQAPPDSGLTLARAIELALEQGVSGHLANITRDVARWRNREFGATLLPRISMTGEVPSLFRRIEPVTQPDGRVLFLARSQTQSSLNLSLQQKLPFTGADFYLSSALSRLALTGTNEVQYWQSSPVVFGLRQPIFRLNTVAWDREAQALTAEVADRAYLEAREDVALATVSAFFAVFSAQSARDNARINVAINDTLYRLNSGRYQVGKIGENDLLQSELALLRARASVEDAELNYDRAVSALRRQIGMPPSGALPISIPKDIPSFEADTAVAVAAALRNRSGTIGSELSRLQAKRGVREAKLNSGFNATLTAEAGFNQSGDSFQDVYRSPLSQQRLALAVELPLLQWGAGKARVEAARLQADRAATETRRNDEQASEDAYIAALTVAQARRQVTIAAKADTVAAKRFDVAMKRYQIEKIDVDNLFFAQGEKDNALAAYISSLGQFWTAFYRLRRVTLHDFVTGQTITER